MAIDHHLIETFINEDITRLQIAKVLRRAGFTIVWIHEYKDKIWGIRIKMNRILRQLFDTPLEILVWVSEFKDFNALTIFQAHDIIIKNQPRVSQDFCLIITGDSDSKSLVENVSTTFITNFVGFSVDSFKDFEPYGQKNFVKDLQSRLYSKDLYYITTAITDRSAFFGRENLIAELLSMIKRGSTHIGLFGLRKMGKTSLLFRLIENINSIKTVLHCHIDIQRVDSIHPSSEYLLWSIGEQLIDSNKQIRSGYDFKMFGKYSSYFDIQNKEAIYEMFNFDISLILKSTQCNLVLFLDEIELMSPETPGSNWRDSFVRFWRLLRGIDQQNNRRFCFFITGTNPRCIEVNRLNDIENPAYNYFTKVYLTQLSEDESSALLTKLGFKMGLSWSKASADLLFRLVGGHPYLLRSYASNVHKDLLPRSDQIEVIPEMVTKLIDRYMVDMNSTFSQLVEIFDDQYTDEFVILETLASGRIAEFRELIEAFPDEVSHLIGYGLVSSDFDNVCLSGDLLHTWLQRRQNEKLSFRKSKERDYFEPGTKVEGYIIDSAIGHKGGFGRVYKAYKQKDNNLKEYYALKILNHGSLESLQREVDALTTITHPNIVRIIDHGKTVGGKLFIAMENLVGKSLKYHVSRATRLPEEKSLQVLTNLIDALIQLHPDDQKVSKFREKDQLTVSELQELNLARHGYIHRDIKPENVMLVKDRGPVLIDFGISIKVAEPVKTISSTPGYLPPDGIGLYWTPDIDLFQLGVTILQVVTGVEFDGTNLRDLREFGYKETKSKLFSILLKMTESQKNKRYNSARDISSELS